MRAFSRWSIRSLAALALLAPFGGAAAGAPQAAPHAPGESWVGIFVDGRKSGYAVTAYQPATWQGAPATRITEHSQIKLELFGSQVGQDEATDSIVDAHYRPLHQKFDISSNGSRVQVDATFDYAHKVVQCVIGSAPDLSRKSVPMPEGGDLSAGSDLTPGSDLKTGTVLKLYYLDPLTVELKPYTLTVGGSSHALDRLTGSDVATTAVSMALPVGTAQFDVDAKGDLVRGTLSVGPVVMLMVREAKSAALDFNDTAPGAAAGASGYQPPADFAVATSVGVDHPIESARTVRLLSIAITGLPSAKMALSDGRQVYGALTPDAGGGFSAHLDVTAVRATAAESSHLPERAAGLQTYLSAAPYLQVNDPGIRAVAARMRAGETNAWRVALRIRNWVHARMTPDATIGVPRGATDIMKRPRGVCRDFSTLYAAVARAAGIPTRLAAGIVYAQGRFFYHAWDEVYVGKWVPVDSTLFDPTHPVDYVDATHIKFAQGDVMQMYDATQVVGHIHVHLVSFR